MVMDVDLYRRTVKLPLDAQGKEPVALSVIDAGPRDALRTLVLLHGFGGRATQWAYQIEHFSGDNRVIAIDLRGHGLSDTPHSRYTVEEGVVRGGGFVPGGSTVAFLGVYAIDSALRTSDIGHFIAIRYEGEDTNVGRNGNNMKKFSIRVSRNVVETADIPF